MTILHDLIYVWANLFWCLKETVLGLYVASYLLFLVAFPFVVVAAGIGFVLAVIRKRG